jgi:dephospho-CoA kinase
MLVIGLTGGIGSGKSVTADMFAARGVPVIDADIIARELVQPGMPALAEIGDRFGPEFIGPDGTLDRAALAQRIFTDPEARAELEAILHPRIRDRMAAQIEALETPYCVLVIPLLVETGQRDLVQRVLVVDAPEAAQRDRVHRRDSRKPTEIEAVMATQAGREARLAVADDVIHNDTDLAALEAQVEALHRKYLQLAAKRQPPASR